MANLAGLRLHSTDAVGKGERRKGQWQRAACERQKSGPEWFGGSVDGRDQRVSGRWQSWRGVTRPAPSGNIEQLLEGFEVAAAHRHLVAPLSHHLRQPAVQQQDFADLARVEQVLAVTAHEAGLLL